MGKVLMTIDLERALKNYTYISDGELEKQNSRETDWSAQYHSPAKSRK